MSLKYKGVREAVGLNRKPLNDQIEYSLEASTPFEANVPAFVMSPPFYTSSDVPNNIWMKELKPEEMKIDKAKALSQWMELYSYMASMSMVYLLPCEKGLQDLVYVANAGIYLPHLKQPTVIVSNFKSEPRRGETKVIKSFFDQFETKNVIAPEYFEGEADLKYLKDNVYIGATGQRTSENVHRWMEENFDMKVITLNMKDEYLYHLDCVTFPLSSEKLLLCTEIVDKATIKEIEKYTEIIDVSYDDALGGINNCVRNGKVIFCASNLQELNKKSEDYDFEVDKVENLSAICAQHGFDPVFINLSELYKSGAMLSCCVMHLNYNDYKFNNI